MGKKFEGSFSLGLESLQLHLNNLFAECGGERAVDVLDRLSNLSEQEQKAALDLFLNLLSRVASGAERIPSADDVVLKDFEESLYRELLDSMREAANSGSAGRAPISNAGSARRFEVVDGGKDKPLFCEKQPVDINEARRRRQTRSSGFVN